MARRSLRCLLTLLLRVVVEGEVDLLPLDRLLGGFLALLLVLLLFLHPLLNFVISI